MQRKTLYILAFVLLVGFTVWYASSTVVVPEYTFAQAAGAGDSVKKVIVPGTVLDQGVVPEGATLTFYMADASGAQSKVFYDGQDPVPAEKITQAKAAGRGIAVSGHVCGDRFHAKGITFQ